MGYDIGPKIGIEGEAQFRQAINGINTNLRTLKTEMSAVTSAFEKNEKSEEALTAKNKVLTKQIDAQKQKLAELTKGLEASSEKYGENHKVTQGWQQAVNNATAELNNMERELEGNAQAISALNEEAQKKALDEYAEQAQKAGEAAKKAVDVGFKAAAAALAAVSAAAIAGAKALVDITKKSGVWADTILTTANQTGLTTQKLQELEYAMRFIDVEVSVITGSLAKLIKNMATASKGTGDAANAFEALGVSIQDEVTGQMRDSQIVFNELIDALGKMENETQRDAYAMQIFGKSAQALNPLIKAGGEELERLTAEAHELGLVLDDEAVGALGRFDDVMQTVDAQTQALGKRIALSLIDPTTNAGKAVSNAIRTVTASLQSGALKTSMAKLSSSLGKIVDNIAEAAERWVPKFADSIAWLVDNGRGLVSTLTAIVATLGTLKAALAISQTVKAAQVALTAYKAAQVAATTATSAATAAQTGLNAALMANPVGAVIAAVAALAVGIGVLIATSKKATNATEDLTDEIRDSREEYEKTKEAIKDEAEEIDELTNSLLKLSEKENKTAADKERMLTIVEKLNSVMPDLNLAYDKQADALNMTADALRAVAAARKTEQAQASNAERLLSLDEQLANVMARREDRQKALNDAQEKYAAILSSSDPSLVGYNADIELAAQNVRNLTNETALLTAEETALLEEQARLETEINEYAAAQNAAAESTQGLAGAQGELAGSLELTEEQINTATEAYDRYAEHTQNAFSAIEEAASQSVDELTGNLLANQQAIAEWASNLASLTERGLDEGLLEELRKAGPEAAGTVREIVNSSDREIQELNEVFRSGAEVAKNAAISELTQEEFLQSGSDAIDQIAGRVGENSSLEDATRAQIAAAFSAANSEISAQNFPSLGEQIVNGIIGGITSRGSAADGAMRTLVQNMLKAAQRASETRSPSRLFKRELGAYIGEGTVQGAVEKINAGVPQIQTAVTNLAEGSHYSTNYSNTIGDLHVHVSGNVDAQSATTVGQAAGDRLGMLLRWKGVTQW